jgi:hypothetical protein
MGFVRLYLLRVSDFVVLIIWDFILRCIYHLPTCCELLGIECLMMLSREFHLIAACNFSVF